MHDPFGAFCTHVNISVSSSSSGPLIGLTFGAKDLFDVKGYVTGAGNPDWLRTHSPASETAPSIQILLDAGASLVGKTVTDELAFSLSGKNIHYGTPINPATPDRIPGGSSSGSASATAGRLVDFALGTDTSGSIRIPSSYCGLFGMRPTHGRISTHGVVHLAPSFDTVGWLAREAEVLYRIGEVLLAEASTPKLPERLLVAEDAFALADKSIQGILKAKLAGISALVQSVEHIQLAQSSLDAWSKTELVLKDYEAWQTHGAWIQAVNPKLAPDIEKRFLHAAKITAAERADAMKERAAIRARLLELLDQDAIICLPTAPGLAPLKNTPAEALDDVRHRTLSLTCIAGLGGLPQVTLPLLEFEGCPVGISLIGAPGNDIVLLSCARELDKRTDPGPR